MRCGGVAGGMRCGTYVVTAATSAQVALRGVVRDHCACCRRSMRKRKRTRRRVSQESRMWFNASPPDEKLRGAERSRIVFTLSTTPSTCCVSIFRALCITCTQLGVVILKILESHSAVCSQRLPVHQAAHQNQATRSREESSIIRYRRYQRHWWYLCRKATRRNRLTSAIHAIFLRRQKSRKQNLHSVPISRAKKQHHQRRC